MATKKAPALYTRALPATVTDLLAQRIVQSQPKLIDEIEKVVIALYDDEEYRALRGEDDPEETVEGSIQDDDTRSAEMIREKGTEMGLRLVKEAKLHDIRLKLRGVERRFNASRKQREAARERPAQVAPASETVE